MKKKFSFLSIALSLVLGLSIVPQTLSATNSETSTSQAEATTVASTSEETVSATTTVEETQVEAFNLEAADATLTVDFSVLTENLDLLSEELAGVVNELPENGLLIEQAPLTSELVEGTTAFDLIDAYLVANNIPHDIPDTEYGPFISSINNVAGGDAGDMSWWNFNVNGEMAPVGIGTYVVQPGDSIELVYYAELEEVELADATLTIDFSTLTNNIDFLSEELAAIVNELSENGLLIDQAPLTSELAEGTTAFDLIDAYLVANNIPHDIPDTEWGPFISSINNVAGGDAGEMSWWNFNVNGEMADEGIGTYVVQPGDSIELVYYAELEAAATLTVDFSTLTNNIDLLSEELASIVSELPENGLLIDQAPLTSELVEGTTAFDLIDAYLVANNIPHDIPDTEWGPFISSINNVAGGDAGDMSWWNFNVNGEMAAEGIGTYEVQLGDSLELVYYAELETEDTSDPNEDLDDIEIVDFFWPSHRGNTSNNGLRDLAEFTPVLGSEIDLVWSEDFTSTGTSAPSQAIIVNNELVFVADSHLYAVNPNTGATIRSLELPGDLGYASTSPLYAEGRIFIPLNNSRLVSFPYANWNAQTSLDEIAGSWSFKDDSDLQVQTALTYSDGQVFLPLLNINRTADSPLIALDAVTGVENWSVNVPGGFYNATAVIDGNKYISGIETGHIIVIDTNNGEILSSTELGNQIRTPLVVSNSEYYVTVNTSGGSNFVKFTVDAAGGVNVVYETPLADVSSSAAVINGDRAYVATQGTSLYVINTNSGEIIREISFDTSFQGITSSPLAVVDGETVHVYFTVNDDSGNIWHFSDNSGATEDAAAEVLYQVPAELRDYSRNSMLMNSNGSIFLGLDNGHYLAIRSTSTDATSPSTESTESSQATGATDATTSTSTDPITATGESQTGLMLVILTMSLTTILIVMRIYIKKKGEEN